MRKTHPPVRIDAPRPRNLVAKALMALGKRTARHGSERRVHDRHRQDLAQRVRELGEW